MNTILYLIGVGIHLPSSIMNSPTSNLIDKSHSKIMTNTMHHEESFSENNILLQNENKVINTIK